MAVARTHREPEFPASRAERLFVATCVALPFAAVLAVTVAVVFGKSAGAGVFIVAVGALVVGLAEWMRPPPEEPVLDDEQVCRVCGARFTRIRVNQIYCGRACRSKAAANRRMRRADPRLAPSTGAAISPGSRWRSVARSPDVRQGGVRGTVQLRRRRRLHTPR